MKEGRKKEGVTLIYFAQLHSSKHFVIYLALLIYTCLVSFPKGKRAVFPDIHVSHGNMQGQVIQIRQFKHDSS